MDKTKMVKNIQTQLDTFSEGQYMVRNINNDYLLELRCLERQDTISSTAIECVESFGVKLRHITIDYDGIYPIVRFDYPITL